MASLRPALPSTAASLETLMERYVDGDPSAFDAIFNQLRGPLTGALRRWLRTDDRVDDALQTTLLKLHSSRSRYQRGAPVLPWVLTIARNVALDRLRSRQSREWSLSEEEQANLAAAPEEAPWSAEDEREVIAAVHEAIEQLPASSQEVIRLHKIEGRPMSEVAQILGIKEGAARVRAHRGYKVLAKLLLGLKQRTTA